MLRCAVFAILQLQTSCPPLVQKSILAYVRDDTVPGVNKIGFPGTVVWDNVTYSDPIVYKDFSTRMAVGENVADRGYVVHKRYSWKVRRGGGGMVSLCALDSHLQSAKSCCDIEISTPVY